MIFEQAIIVASDTDVLNGTRLNAIPYNGTLVIQFCSNLANATNSYAATIQLPNGDVPVDSQIVACGLSVENVLGGQLDTRFLTEFRFPATQGGHFILGFAETGAAILVWRAVLTP